MLRVDWYWKPRVRVNGAWPPGAGRPIAIVPRPYFCFYLRLHSKTAAELSAVPGVATPSGKRPIPDQLA